MIITADSRTMATMENRPNCSSAAVGLSQMPTLFDFRIFDVIDAAKLCSERGAREEHPDRNAVAIAEVQLVG